MVTSIWRRRPDLMAKITLYVPRELRERIDGPEGDEVNWSRVFRRAAIAELNEQRTSGRHHRRAS